MRQEQAEDTLKLTAEACEVLLRIAAEHAASPFAADTVDRLRPEFLCRAQQALALDELLHAGMLELRQKVWGEKLYQIPQRQLSFILRSFWEGCPQVRVEGSVQVELAACTELAAEVFRGLLFIAQEGLPLTAKGVIHKKQLSRLAGQLSMQEQHAALLRPASSRPESYPLPVTVIIDLLTVLGLISRHSSGYLPDRERLQQWLSLSAQEMTDTLYTIVISRYGSPGPEEQHFRHLISAAEFTAGEWFAVNPILRWMMQQGLAKEWSISEEADSGLKLSVLAWISLLAGFGWCELGTSAEGEPCFRWKAVKPQLTDIKAGITSQGVAGAEEAYRSPDGVGGAPEAQEMVSNSSWRPGEEEADNKSTLALGCTPLALACTPLAPGSARLAPGSAPLALDCTPPAPGSAPLAPACTPLTPGSAPLAPDCTPLALDYTPLALDCTPLAPDCTPLAPGSAPPALDCTPLAQGSAPSAPGCTPLAPDCAASGFIVQPDFEVLVPPEVPYAVRWTLAGYAELLHNEDLWSFRLTRERLEAAAEQGSDPSEVIAWLSAHAAGGLPEQVELSLRQWARGIGRTVLADVLLLSCAGEQEGQDIAEHPRLQDIVTRIGPLHFIVRPEAAGQLRKELTAAGLAPSVRTGGANEDTGQQRLFEPFAPSGATRCYELPSAAGERGLLGTGPSPQLLPLDRDSRMKLELPGEEAVPQMWFNQWRQYHITTAQKIMEQALGWGIKVRLSHQGRAAEFIPERISGRPWKVRGILLLPDTETAEEIELAAEDWEEMKLLHPLNHRNSSSAGAGGYVMIR
ncbi:helicase-associated domain-containing protein [Paenibacillus tritici]|uniref:Helicase-associated domain-containing protein n=1 Tax=Paenibacillus tritici TaxID=1873425 RepID=A0ABX2DJ28_9BACL|nr:helicase-associated domain-containing protein [Paenibacillus tritici]NQX43831.1 helicase-associated domain-containing protein [Paenibacillus tritici]